MSDAIVAYANQFFVYGWDRFLPNSRLHLISVCVCAATIAALAWAGRRLRSDRELMLRHALGIFGIVYWISYNIWWNRKGFVPASGLPLHICDLNGLIAPLALLTLNRWLRATLYFWTFALTTQAFIQPNLVHGPAAAIFWFFWMQHTLIVACAVYDLAVLRFRPEWPDLRRACTAFPVNILLGSNYGFVGDPPPPERIPPFVAMLGPWPERVLVIVALAAIGFALLALPWQRSRQESKEYRSRMSIKQP
jgi:hypothetical integral membrane protein (TIGR02206 family)